MYWRGRCRSLRRRVGVSGRDRFIIGIMTNIELNMSSYINTISCWVKTSIPMVVRAIPEKHTWGRAKIHFMTIIGTKEWKTLAPKYAKEGLIRSTLKAMLKH